MATALPTATGIHPAARAVLITAALVGLVTAMPLWVPAGIVIGAAAFSLGPTNSRHDPASVPHA
jgi:hypothetical protein